MFINMDTTSRTSSTSSNWDKVTKSAERVWNSLQNSFSSFNGFSNALDESSSSDNIISSLYNIKTNKKSTTVYINPDRFTDVTAELTARYGSPTPKGNNGEIYKCNMSFDDSEPVIVTITSYSTTAVLHVQGALHGLWVEFTLHQIQQRLSHQDHNLSVSIDDLCPPPLTSTPEKQKSLTTTSSTASPTVTEIATQTNTVDESPMLQDTVIALREQIRELSDRVIALQVEVDSIKGHRQDDNDFRRPKSPAISSPKPASIPTVPVSNAFNILTDELLEPAPLQPTAPSISLMTPPPPRPPPKQQTRKQSSPPKPDLKPPGKHQSPHTSANQQSPDIVIFSNSICKRINTNRFLRGKKTNLIAKSGATIMDIRREVLEYTNVDKPEYVILQAWTNSASRESTEACAEKAKSLINTTMKKFPESQIIISGILPRLIPLAQSNAVNRAVIDLNDILDRECQNNPRLSFVNHAESFVARDGHIYADLYWDNIHPRYEGLRIMVNNLRNVISSYKAQCQYPHLVNHQGIK